MKNELLYLIQIACTVYSLDFPSVLHHRIYTASQLTNFATWANLFALNYSWSSTPTSSKECDIIIVQPIWNGSNKTFDPMPVNHTANNYKISLKTVNLQYILDINRRVSMSHELIPIDPKFDNFKVVCKKLWAKTVMCSHRSRDFKCINEVKIDNLPRSL